MTDIITENKLSKIKQKKLLIITAIGISGVLLAFLSSSPQKKPSSLSQTLNNSKNKIILQDPNNGLNAEDRWLYDATKKLDEYGEFQKNYSQDKDNLESRLKEVEGKYEEMINSQSKLLEFQNQEIEALKQQIKEGQPSRLNSTDPFSGQSQATQSPVSFNNIQTTNFDLEDFSQEGDFFNTSEYVPAGSYAKAKIISGVDASVGISAQSDPRPILIRVLGPALSSIYEGNIQKADLAGCLILGAASGDLSSEKVYVKLVNMTCAKSEDLVFETAVKGYVSGQGKSGIRGNVISRAGDIVAKSFLAGLLGGFGQGISASVAPPLNFSNGLTTQSAMNVEDISKRGLGQGVASSGDRLANYYITRAEQYQPVVSIPSDIDVEVVFVEGFKLNGKQHRKSSAPSNKFVDKFEGGK